MCTTHVLRQPAWMLPHGSGPTCITCLAAMSTCRPLYYRGAGDGLYALHAAGRRGSTVPRHRQWVGTVGSVGQPRDGDSRAMYALFDDQRAQLTFHRVRYDYLVCCAGHPTRGFA